jgi:DNA polymerase-3 subunit epsilon
MHPDFQWIGKSADGETVTLKRFGGRFRLAPEPDKDKIRRAIALDVETTGLNRKSDRIIEIGIRSFQFNRATGELVTVGPVYEGLQDPGEPLSDDIKRLTGLTDDMLRGKAIDWKAVASLLDDASLVIAHNASFDRPFIERMTKASAEKVWGCSLKQVGWRTKGFTSSKLEVLSIYHGFFTDAHRALADADALIHLLSHEDHVTRRPYFHELLATARRPLSLVIATNSPFETKDALKERGYSWDNNERVWKRHVFRDDVAAEVAWMESAVYKGDFRGRVVEIPLHDNFK